MQSSLARMVFVALLVISAAGGGCSSPALAAHAENGALVMVPAGTAITLVPKIPTQYEGVGAINVGDSVDFVVKNPVIINGWVAIPQGAAAHGTISDVTMAGLQNHGMFRGLGVSAGSLHYAFDWIQLSTGRVRLDGTPVEVKGRELKRSVKGAFGITQTIHQGLGPDPGAGVEAKTATDIHVTTTVQAPRVETQNTQFIDK